jgi:ferredoxin-NAD(P)+ reductase (naphthalene dioxygenase ferredoxin-specific)
MELVVNPLDRHIKVDSGSNLLDVLREHGVPISYSCMSGRCGTCRCRVVEGRVFDAGPEAGRPLVGGKDSHVLACQAVLTDNCTIELPDVDDVIVHPARIVKGVVTAIEAVTHDIRRLRVSWPSRWRSARGSTSPCSSRPTTFAPTPWPGSWVTATWSFTSARCPMAG